jgi:hypothetical protein
VASFFFFFDMKQIFVSRVQTFGCVKFFWYRLWFLEAERISSSSSFDMVAVCCVLEAKKSTP